MKIVLSLAAAALAAAPLNAQSAALDRLRAAAGSDAVVTVSAPAAAPVPVPPSAAPALPDEFTVHEEIISVRKVLLDTDTFDLKGGSGQFGKIIEKFLTLTKDFTYVDASGQCVAKSRARLISWGTHVDVSDCAGRPIGAFQEHVLRSLFKVNTVYSILDGQGKEIATSEKVEWISTSLTLRRPDGSVIAELHRPWLNILSDNWDIKIRDHAAVDARVIVLIAAYKTSVDNDRREEQDAKDEKKKKDDDDDDK
jgi:uncharacterized protein YxjI